MSTPEFIATLTEVAEAFEHLGVPSCPRLGSLIASGNMANDRRRPHRPWATELSVTELLAEARQQVL